LSLPARIGKFEILRRIGKGAMGEVFLGRDTILGREVAIKTILASSSFGEEAKARFEREAKSTARLNHPNIVTVFEFGEDEGLHFLAMEFLEGEDLDSMIQKSALNRNEFLDVLAQTCEGLAYAHEQGVIHRDVKPANILVIRRGKRLTAKLMDFGVALVNQSNLTEQGTWMGTANYMAPEYLDTGKASPSSDLFAVGVMLYEVVSGGRKPFTGETTTLVLNAILRNPPQPFRPEEIQAVGPQLLKVIRKALAKNPEDRYHSAELLANAIREAAEEAAGRPAVPMEPPPVRREPADKPLIVGKGGKATCLSLRVALRQATPGACITILPGVYRESLVVDKSITIVGEGNPLEIVLESSHGPCLTLKAPLVELRGLTLRRSATERGDDAPLILVQSGRTMLEDCELTTEAHDGLRIEGLGSQVGLKRCHVDGRPGISLNLGAGTSANLSHCLMEGHRKAAIQVGPNGSVQLVHTVLKEGDGMGLRIRMGGQAQLEDCELVDCQAGSLEVESEGRAQLRRCRLDSSRYAGVLACDKGQASLEACDVLGHALSGLHASDGALVSVRQSHIHRNGFGVSVMHQGLCTLEDCELDENIHPGVLIQEGGTAQIKNSKLHDGQSLGVVCSARGRGVLEGCEIFGNAQSGAKVERGGSLLLVRCVLRDGRDTGMLLFEDAELTLEECVVHRNARGGILLSKDASDPILRGGNQIEDDLLRANPQGGLTKLAPVRRR
jgi:nitrous oxidase accessory protein NosD/predicted Ser/Thr protein kinase